MQLPAPPTATVTLPASSSSQQPASSIQHPAFGIQRPTTTTATSIRAVDGHWILGVFSYGCPSNWPPDGTQMGRAGECDLFLCGGALVSAVAFGVCSYTCTLHPAPAPAPLSCAWLTLSCPALALRCPALSGLGWVGWAGLPCGILLCLLPIAQAFLLPLPAAPHRGVFRGADVTVHVAARSSLGQSMYREDQEPQAILCHLRRYPGIQVPRYRGWAWRPTRETVQPRSINGMRTERARRRYMCARTSHYITLPQSTVQRRLHGPPASSSKATQLQPRVVLTSPSHTAEASSGG